MKKLMLCLAISLSLPVSSGFAVADDKMASQAAQRANDILDRLDDISYGNVDRIKEDLHEDVRLRAMKEAAQTIGAQEGYAYYINRFIALVEDNDRYMKHFDFGALMSATSDDAREMYVLPPVIEKLVNAEAVNQDGTQLKLSGEVYRILSNVRLVTAPPTWRDYLVPGGFSNTNTPPTDLLPKNRKEENMWKNWVREGFRDGMSQGDLEMKSRVSQLRTDYVGMVRYLNLVENNMVKEPTVAMQHIRVEGDTGEMKVRSSVYEVTNGAELNTSHTTWNKTGHDDNRQSVR